VYVIALHTINFFGTITQQHKLFLTQNKYCITNIAII